MIIGISGHICSGKDTVGRIIQYLISQKRAIDGTFRHLDIEPSDIDYWTLGHFIDISGYSTKRLASKIKEICSILTGIPVEDFEKQEVKDRILGEEWNKSCSLKSCSICKEDTYCTVKYENNCHIKFTVRELLQQVGTDVMRNVIHPNVWVNALFADYKGIPNTEKNPYDENTQIREYLDWSLWFSEWYPNWIVTDVRFSNEAQAIKDRGGLLIRVVSNAPCPHCGERENIHANIDYSSKFYKVDNWLCNECGTTFEKSTHESETALDDYVFDYTLIDDGTIEELIEQVKLILIKRKII
jgi:ribosomal protein L37AE/L43A